MPMTPAYRAEHYRDLHLTIPREVGELLDRLMAERGEGKTAVISRLIRQAARKKKKGARTP